MSNPHQPPPGVSPEEYAGWLAKQDRRLDTKSARHTGLEWKELLDMLAQMPPETEEERAAREKRLAEDAQMTRLAAFKKTCPPEFMDKIDRGRLTDPAAFDRFCTWDGCFPGPIGHGPTNCAKTRAAWSVLGRLNVREGKSLAWFPVKRLITEFIRYESKDLADEFWRFYRGFNILFVDDVDKINWQFESESAALFSFYDWIYRENRPCVTTTNKPREWWANQTGDAFTRRLFDDAHFAVKFQ